MLCCWLSLIISTRAKCSLLQRSHWWFLLCPQAGSGDAYLPELHGRLEETRWWLALVPFLMWVNGKWVIYGWDQADLQAAWDFLTTNVLMNFTTSVENCYNTATVPSLHWPHEKKGDSISSFLFCFKPVSATVHVAHLYQQPCHTWFCILEKPYQTIL